MGSRVISHQRLVNICQLDVNFLNINNIFWASNKQSGYWNWFFDSWRLHLRRHILAAWCDEYVVIHYNSNNNAYCRALNAETFQKIEHNTVWISILLCPRNPYSYSHFEIVIGISSVRGDIDQMLTNTSSYTICSAPNVYLFVYILIETRTAPLNKSWKSYDLPFWQAFSNEWPLNALRQCLWYSELIWFTIMIWNWISFIYPFYLSMFFYSLLFQLSPWGCWL